MVESWDFKGMCPNCGAWLYLYAGDELRHCAVPLINVIPREEQEQLDRQLAWDFKGMCPNCNAWCYLHAGDELRHCAVPLVNVISREEQGQLDGQFTPEGRTEWVNEVLMEPFSRHIDVLLRKYKATHVIDDYGIEREAGWLNELHYFLQNVVGVPDDHHMYAFALQVLDGTVSDAVNTEQTDPSAGSAVEALDPAGFERYCVDVLQATGWMARRTGMSGDQGVDVVAERSDLRIAIQCKLYSHPVGNAAVQEALAGMVYEGASRACVVSNASYTTAARQLASVAGVLLIHYSDLPRLAQLLGLEPLPD